MAQETRWTPPDADDQVQGQAFRGATDMFGRASSRHADVGLPQEVQSNPFSPQFRGQPMGRVRMPGFGMGWRHPTFPRG